LARVSRVVVFPLNMGPIMTSNMLLKQVSVKYTAIDIFFDEAC